MSVFFTGACPDRPRSAPSSPHPLFQPPKRVTDSRRLSPPPQTLSRCHRQLNWDARSPGCPCPGASTAPACYITPAPPPQCYQPPPRRSLDELRLSSDAVAASLGLSPSAPSLPPRSVPAHHRSVLLPPLRPASAWVPYPLSAPIAPPTSLPRTPGPISTAESSGRRRMSMSRRSSSLEVVVLPLVRPASSTTLVRPSLIPCGARRALLSPSLPD